MDPVIPFRRKAEEPKVITAVILKEEIFQSAALLYRSPDGAERRAGMSLSPTA